MTRTGWLNDRTPGPWAAPVGRARRRAPRGRRAAPPLYLEQLEDRCLPSVTLVRDINTAPAPLSPAHLTAVGGRLFFTADVPGLGRELWVSDGAEEGTRLVRDITPGSNSTFDSRSTEDWTAVGGRLIVTADVPGLGGVVWVS